MKKSVFAPFLFFVLAIGLTAQIRLGLNGGYAMPSNSNYKGGIAMGFQLGFGLGEHFAVEIGVSRFRGNVVGTADGLSAGSLTRMPIELSLQLRFPLGSKKLVPYIFAGGGYSLNSFDLIPASPRLGQPSGSLWPKRRTVRPPSTRGPGWIFLFPRSLRLT